MNAPVSWHFWIAAGESPLEEVGIDDDGVSVEEGAEAADAIDALVPFCTEGG